MIRRRHDVPKRKCDWEGRKVRLKHDHQNRGGTIFRAGTVMLVTRNFGGLHLVEANVCPHCGRSDGQIKGLCERDVELLPNDSTSLIPDPTP